MSDHDLSYIFGQGCEYCEITKRPFEQGIGALSHEQQTAAFVRERDYLADVPKEGEICTQTGRPYEIGSGALTKTAQSRKFINDLSPTEKAQRAEAAAALNARPAEGSA